MAIKTEFLDGVETSARMYRGILTDLFTEGVKDVLSGQFKVVQRAAGANMTVTVQKGSSGNAVGYITGDDFDGQGLYRAEMDADWADLAVSAAPASGSRTDLVVLETVDKSAVGGSTNETRLRVLPNVFALTVAQKSMIPLARLAITAGQSSIQTANITDLRTQAGKATLDFSVKKATGSYAGDGAATRSIAVGFTPDLVIVTSNGGGFAWLHSNNSGNPQSALLSGSSTGIRSSEYLNTTGFVVSNNGALNGSGTSYVWSAYRFVAP